MSKDSSAVSEVWGFTQLRKMQFNYTWTIENFASCWEGMGEKIWSSPFSTGTNVKSLWSLVLSPKSNQSDDHVSIFLHLEESNKSEACAKFGFTIVNAKRNKEKSTQHDEVYRFKPGQTWGFQEFINRDYLLSETNGLLSDENLTVVCKVIVFPDPTNISEHDNDVQHKVSVDRLLEDYKKLFENPKHSDVALTVGGKTFYAHKAVLATRSRVFAAMFDHEMEESKKNHVEIGDVDHDVFIEILRFIYTGNSNNLKEMAAEVLAAAEKYDLEELKVMCELAMFKGLSADNAAKTLIYADLYCARQLRAQAIDFINTHLRLVMETPGFKSMMSSHPALFEDVLRAIATRRSLQ